MRKSFLLMGSVAVATIAGAAAATEVSVRHVNPTFAEIAKSEAVLVKPKLPEAIDSPVEMVTHVKVAADGTLSVECAERAVSGSGVRYGVVHDHVHTVEE